MAYTKQTWNDLPNTTTPITAEKLNHIEDGIYGVSTTTATTSVDGLMSSGDKTKLGRIGITSLLPSASAPISTKTTVALSGYAVTYYDFIVVVATANQYNHRQCITWLKGQLYDSMYQLIQFDETHWDNTIKIYGNTIDTTISTLLGTSTYHINAIYGIKIS